MEPDVIATSTAPANQPEPAHDRTLDLFTLGALLALTVPLAVALVSAGQQHWYPTGDMAQADLHMRGFFRHPPLVGAAGRIGSILTPYGQGSHPGPAMWVAMLPVYLLFGRSTFGLMASTTVVQLAFIVLTVWLVRRLAGSLAGLVVACAAAVLVHSLGAAVFIEPWNPWLGIFAFFACIAACWGVLCGRHRWLWIAATTGTFAVQAHAGYIPLVGALLAALAGLTLWRWRRNRAAGYGRWWWVAVGAFVVMWIPPMIDQWRRSPGNARILFHHFTSTTEDDGRARVYVGVTGAFKAFAGEFSVTGPWVRGAFRQPYEPPNWLTFLLAVGVVAAALVALRRLPSPQRRPLALLFGLLGGSALVGLFATSRIFGEFYSYVIRWWWVLVAWAAIAVVLTLLNRVRRPHVAGGALLAVACLATGVATINAADTEVPAARNSEITGGLTQMIERDLAPDGSYLVRWYDPATLSGVPFGVILELERDGYQVGVDSLSSAAALPHRVLAAADASAVLWIVAGEQTLARFRANPRAVEVGYFDQRTSDEIARSAEVRAQLEQRLTDLGLACVIPTLDNQYGLAPLVIGGIDVPGDVRTLAAEYVDLGIAFAAFTVPTDEPWYDGDVKGCD